MIQRQIAALNRGDIDESIEGFDPEIEWVIAREHPASRTVRGLDELRHYWEDWREMLGSMSFEPERIADHGNLVISLGRVKGVGTGSGAEADVPIAFVSHFRNGVVVRVEEFLNPQEALEAAGLSE